MALTLEQVRATRFHLARRNGYEPSDVDDFVDNVEATLVTLYEENDQLKSQVEQINVQPTGNIFAAAGETSDEFKADLQASRDELNTTRQQLLASQAQVAKSDEDATNLRRELSLRDEELVALRAEAQTLRQAAAASTSIQQAVPPSDQVENLVVTTSEQASTAVTRLLAMATEQSERLVGESKSEAQRLISDARSEVETLLTNANQRAHETLADARNRAEKIESDARESAERVTSEAQSKAEAINAESEQARVDAMSKLEIDRDELSGKVEHLRTFESIFRSNIVGHLEKQIVNLKDAVFEPSDIPELLEATNTESTTPRLDALLGGES